VKWLHFFCRFCRFFCFFFLLGFLVVDFLGESARAGSRRRAVRSSPAFIHALRAFIFGGASAAIALAGAPRCASWRILNLQGFKNLIGF
jgi:hypothetical protein